MWYTVSAECAFIKRKWDWKRNRIYSYQCHPFTWKFSLKNDFVFGTASHGLGTFCIWWYKPAHFPTLSQTGCRSVCWFSSSFNTSVDRQWTFCKGHLNKTEQCLPCIYQWKTFSSLLQILSFSFWKLETSAKKTRTEDSSLSS